MTWTLNSLLELLQRQDDLTVTTEGDALLLTNDEGIDAVMTVSGDQIVVESLLSPTAKAKDSIGFNDLILRTHKQLFPLTAMAITRIDGDDYYAAFGSLSSQSKEESVLIEISLLFQNVEGMLEFYEEKIG